MEEQLNSPCKSDVSELTADLRLLTGSDRTFRVRLAALVDLYGALSRTSKSLQSLQLLPWERQARFAGLVVKLQLMTDSLPRTPAPRTSRASLDASDIRRELQRRDDPEEMREQWPTLARYRENLTAEQVSEVAAFSASLAAHCDKRRFGVDSRGSSKGSSNSLLMGAMEDIQRVADLQELRRSRSSDVLRSVDSAIHRLVSRGVIPERVPPRSLRLAYEAIHALAGDMDNPEMLSALWKMAADGQPELWPFLHLVVRLWLISPSESVVESMAGIVKVVFGPHRRLLHENAAKELIIRWNGPELCSADGLGAAKPCTKAYKLLC